MEVWKIIFLSKYVGSMLIFQGVVGKPWDSGFLYSETKHTQIVSISKRWSYSGWCLVWSKVVVNHFLHSMMRNGSHWYFLHFHGWLVESVQIWNTQHGPHTQDGNMYRYTIVYRSFPKQWCHQPAIEFGMMKWWTLTHLSTCITAIQPLECAGHIFRSTDKCLVENEDDWISILPIKRFSSWPLIPNNTPGSTLKLTVRLWKEDEPQKERIVSQPPKHH